MSEADIIKPDTFIMENFTSYFASVGWMQLHICFHEFTFYKFDAHVLPCQICLEEEYLVLLVFMAEKILASFLSDVEFLTLKVQLFCQKKR